MTASTNDLRAATARYAPRYVRTRSGSKIHRQSGSRTECGARATVAVDPRSVGDANVCDRCAHPRVAAFDRAFLELVNAAPAWFVAVVARCDDRGYCADGSSVHDIVRGYAIANGFTGALDNFDSDTEAVAAYEAAVATPDDDPEGGEPTPVVDPARVAVAADRDRTRVERSLRVAADSIANANANVLHALASTLVSPLRKDAKNKAAELAALTAEEFDTLATILRRAATDAEALRVEWEAYAAELNG